MSALEFQILKNIFEIIIPKDNNNSMPSAADVNIIEFISTKISGKEVAQASKVIPIKSSDKFSCLPIFREYSINEKEPFQSRPIPNASCKKGKRMHSLRLQK